MKGQRSLLREARMKVKAIGHRGGSLHREEEQGRSSEARKPTAVGFTGGLWKEFRLRTMR